MSNYNPLEIEQKWYDKWTQNRLFESMPDDNRKPYSIVIPPPNVTGKLHLGHALDNTIQDALIRRARMQGKNACWVPGTDHASIATEAKVVGMLKDKGIDKNTLSREKFLEYAWEWKEEYGGIILNQLKRLGASCDWKRTSFTMDDHYYKAVIKIFTELHQKGFIYRGTRMINWDPVARTALSNEEVFYKEESSTLYYIKYPLENSSDFVTIATTRPETILADTGICVNPNDERHKHLIGHNAVVPLVNRTIPIVADDYVDPEFGSGALKITPAHDPNDFELGAKHGLETINMLNEDGTLNNEATLFVNEDRFTARKSVANALKKENLLAHTEAIQNNVGYSQRTDAPIEPRISTQWFCRMKEMAQPALNVVMNDQIRFHPGKFKNTYKHWMENIQDWCISRQLWWGHRIPAYYYGEGPDDFVVAETPEKALIAAREKSGRTLNSNDLQQDEDVLDTWFSSWLWPMEVFKGITEPNHPDFKYYYPTSVLVTGPDILFFWVARMIMAGLEFKNTIPFSDVYFHGMVRDKQRRKMSKSLGNSPDLLKLIDQYGADGVRFSILVSSPAGNDLLFDEKKCEQGRNFCNKLWNALRLIESWADKKENRTGHDESNLNHAVPWIENKLQETIIRMEDHYRSFRISDAVMDSYRFAWNDFCSWYLEMIKPPRNQSIDHHTYERTVAVFESILKLLHPFLPFITEEAWQQLNKAAETNNPSEHFLAVQPYPEAETPDPSAIRGGDRVCELITRLRNTLTENEIKADESDVFFQSDHPDTLNAYSGIIQKLTGIRSFSETNEKKSPALTLILSSGEFFIPFYDEQSLKDQVNRLEEELKYTRGFLKSVDKKMNNPKFVENAKAEIVERERQKKADAEEKISRLEEHLNNLTQKE